MKILKGLSRKEFNRKFGTEDQCLQYLSEQKWKEGYFLMVGVITAPLFDTLWVTITTDQLSPATSMIII
ncbi:MAG: hypothetical protein H6578_02490 [Chitinophagales bacterium]|nr:hypothetical protein [Chitinophagales bacterium]